LRIDIGSSLPNLILIPALPDFRARYPDIYLYLGVSDRPVDLVEERVDCVIRTGTLPDSSLVSRRLAELDYITCASPAYLATHGVPMHPQQPERGHDLISYFSSLTGKPRPLLFNRDDGTFEIGRGTTVAVKKSKSRLTALIAGLGISQTYHFMARPHIECGALVPVLQDWHRPRHELHVLYPSNRHLQTKLKNFVDRVVDTLAPFDSPKT
jgi:DNA-binding transcriptional LysR family regulator